MKFTIGNVYGLTLSTVGKALGPLLGVTLILSIGIGGVLPVLLRFGLTSANVPAAGLVTLIATLLTYLASAAQWSAVTDIALTNAANKRIEFGAVLANSARNALPVLLIGILWFLGAFVGWMLLIIPGTIFIVIFIVTVPAYIAEKPGMLNAFTRSRDLTRGHRWGIFGLNLLTNICLIIVFYAVLFGGVLASAGGNLAGGAVPKVGAAAIVIAMLFIAFLNILIPVLNTALYITLRNEKGDPLTGALEKVFE